MTEETMPNNPMTQDALGASGFEPAVPIGRDRDFVQPDPTLEADPQATAKPSAFQDAFFADRAARKAARLSNSIASVAGTNADAAAANQALGAQVGVSPGIAERNADRVKRRADFLRINSSSASFAFKDPILADFMSDPKFLSVAHDDLDSLYAAANLLKRGPRGFPGFRRGLLQREMFRNQSDQLFGISTPEQDTRVIEIEKELADMPVDEQYLANAGELSGQIGGGVPSILFRVAEGAAIGAGAGLLGFGVGAVPMGIVGGGRGAIVGFAEEAFNLEAGSKYGEMIKAGFDRETAIVGAVTYGAISASIEMLGAKVVTAPYRLAMGKAIATATAKTTAELVVRPTAKAVIKSSLAHYFKAIAAETGTEVTQQILSIAVDEVALRYAESNLESRITTAEGLFEIMDEVRHVAEKVAKGMSILSAVGGGVHYVSESRAVQESERSARVFKEIAENTKGSKLQLRDPSKREAFIASQASAAGVDTVYMRATDLIEVLKQDPITDSAMDEVLPGVREQIADAQKLGGSLNGVDVTIPMSVFATRLAGTKLGDKLVGLMRVKEDAVSAKDLPAFIEDQKQRQKEAEATMAERLKTDGKWVAEAQQIESDVVEALVSAGRDPDAAKVEAKFVQAIVVTGAAREGITPLQWVAKNALPRIAGTKDAAQGTASPAQQAPAQGPFGQSQISNSGIVGLNIDQETLDYLAEPISEEGGSANFQAAWERGERRGTGKWSGSIPHHERGAGGAWTYGSMFDVRREALLDAIITGDGAIAGYTLSAEVPIQETFPNLTGDIGADYETANANGTVQSYVMVNNGGVITPKQIFPKTNNFNILTFGFDVENLIDKETKTPKWEVTFYNAEILRETKQAPAQGSFEQSSRADLGLGQQTAFNEANYRPAVVAWAKEKFGDRTAPDGSTVWQNFTEWFGDSKVVDAEGKPMVVYHGTRRNFSEFREDETRNRLDDNGYYFTDSPSEASAFATGQGLWPASGNVMPVYALLKNPLAHDFKGEEFTSLSLFEVVKTARKNGHDGVIVNNIQNFERGPTSTTYIAFHPTQIKSAIGNAGEFSATDPNILRQDAVGEFDEVEVDKEIEQGSVPISIDALVSLKTTFALATGRAWDKGVHLKREIQRLLKDKQALAGVDVSIPSPQSNEYLVRVGILDALFALGQNPNSVGWYDEKTREALEIAAIRHPELLTDENAKLAFVWALSVTSNGMKVGKNFELADQVYTKYKQTGMMPTDIKAGQAQKAINESLGAFNELKEKWGIDNLRKFMLTDYTVGEIGSIAADMKPKGEHVDVAVRGSAILGPKIGNGFFANLYGKFDSLTMDRWLVRTWGRWTGTLIKEQPVQTAKAKARAEDAISAVRSNPIELLRIQGIVAKFITGADVKQIGKLRTALKHQNALKKVTDKRTAEIARLTSEIAELDARIKSAPAAALAQMNTDEFALLIAEKVSIKPELRAELNKTELGTALRLTSNSYSKYLDGQKEAPSGPHERKWIRMIFRQILQELQKKPEFANLTMADLQAALWYAEKRLYETAGEDTVEDSSVDKESTGYADNEAPDYSNASADVARGFGISEERIAEAIQKARDDGRAAAARSGDEQVLVEPKLGGKQGAAGGFTPSEKRAFRRSIATLTARTRAESGGSVAGHEKNEYSRSNSDRGRIRLLKSLKARYTEVWKAGADISRIYRAAGISTPEFYELQQTVESGNVFAAKILAFKSASPFGASVAVYSPEEYSGMKMFLSGDGLVGVAVKPNGDVVSVFSGVDSNAGAAAVNLSIAAGGKKLDAFDTILPDFYAPHGFRVVSRLAWDDSQAPVGWDKAVFAKFNSGEPDVVFMALDEQYFGSYSPTDGIVGKDYDDAVAIQEAVVAAQPVASGVLNQSAVPATFYSALSVEVGKSTTKSASADSWKQQIKGLIAKGVVKEREVFWSGLDNWLDLQEGKITKEQAQAFLAAGGVKVKVERSKDEQSASELTARQAIANAKEGLGGLLDLELENTFNEYEELVINNLQNSETAKDRARRVELEEVIDEALDAVDMKMAWEFEAAEEQESASFANVFEPKYAGYQLPGGTNYREVLVTLPVGFMPSAPAISKEGLDARKVVFDKYAPRLAEIEAEVQKYYSTQSTDETAAKINNAIDLLFNEREELETKRDAEANALYKIPSAPQAKPFISSHWDESNVLVHLRLNDRVDADGKKVLFVEEVQSDWGQQGREKGFVNLTWKAALEKEGIKLVKESALKRDNALQALGSWRNEKWEGRPTLEILAMIVSVSYLGDGWASRFGIESDSDIAIINDYIQTAKRSVDVDRQLTEIDSHIPVAPFVETTSGWLELGLKQIMLEAVNGGYDRVAFVDGDQSVERYRRALTQAVDEVEIQRNDDGTYTYNANKGGGTIQREASVSAKRIGEVFGKAGSKQLLEQADANPESINTIASSDIEIGGEGMRKFYDTIVPQALNKMLKKLGGGKVENVNMITEKPVTQEQINAAERRRDFTESERLTAIYERQQLGRGISEKGDQQVGEQRGFAVTPALAEQVSQGLPLFQAAEGDARGSYDPVANLMRLGKNADQSTFAHELAHWYLVNQFNSASDPTASAQTKADADKTLVWFGIPGENLEQRLANWNAMSLDQQRRYHESFAYNWEIYLFEGRSPSVEMQSVFAMFKRWMTRVYISIRDDLNAVYRKNFGEDLPFLTDEIRAVFDRVLASEEQIQQQEAIDSIAATFSTQEESGMSNEEWGAYKAMEVEAHDQAVTDLTKASLRQMQWLGKARSRMLRELQARNETQRKQVRSEVAAEVGARPVYQAISLLKTGKATVANGTPVELKDGFKLNLEDVKKMVPAEDLLKFGFGKYGMVATDGMHPDMVAEMFGFKSGDELVLAILETKPLKEAIEEQTDKRMLAKYGGMQTAAELEAEVQKALHNEARARFVAVELRFLSKATQPVQMMLQGAKQIARKILGAKVIRSIRVSEYTSAEARSAKEASTAAKTPQSDETASKTAYTRSYNAQIAQGVEEAVAVEEATREASKARESAAKKIADHKKRHSGLTPAVVAIKEKQHQLIQHQLAKEAIDVKEEIEKAKIGFRKFFKTDERTAKTRDVDVVSIARSILAWYGFGKHGKSPAAYVAQLVAYNPALYEQLEPLITRSTDTGGSRDYRDLTVDEFRILRDSVEALWTQARRDKQIEVEGELLQLEDVVGELEKRVETIGVPEVVAGETSAPTRKERFGRALMHGKALLRRVEHWADATDGAGNKGGPFTRYIFRPIQKSIDNYRQDRNKYVKRFVDLLAAVDLPVGKIQSGELNYTFGNGNGGIGKAEVLGALLHTGNESNFRKLILGRRWGTLDENGELDTSKWDTFLKRMIDEGVITKADFDFVQAVWDLNEEIKPIAQKAHHSLFGYYFQEVEATPLETPFGTYRGGYVPAKTDSFIVRDAARNAKMEELESDFRNSMPSTGMGFTKARKEYNEYLSLDVRLVASHINDVLRFAYVQPAIKDVLRILKDRGFANRLSRIDATAIDDMLIPWLTRSARQSVSTKGMWASVDAFWRTVRSRTGMSIMFANVRNALQQTTGLFPASLKVESKYLKGGLTQYLSNPRQLAREVTSMSKYMESRTSNQMFDLQEAMNDLLLNPSKYDKVKDWSSKHAYFMQMAMQNMVDLVAWTGAYNQAIVDIGPRMSEAKAQAEAVSRADAAVRLTQGSMAAEGISQFEVGTPAYRIFVQFTGYFNMMANLNADEFTKVFRDLGWRGNKGKLFAIYLLGFALPALVSDAIVRTLGGTWDDDDDDGYLDDFAAWFFGSQIRAAAAMLPFGSSVATALTAGFTDATYDDRISSSPAIGALEASTVGVAKAAINVIDEDRDVTGKNVRDVLTLVSLVTGVPVTALGKPIGYVVDVERGAIEPTSPTDFVRGLVTGVASEPSKNR